MITNFINNHTTPVGTEKHFTTLVVIMLALMPFAIASLSGNI